MNSFPEGVEKSNLLNVIRDLCWKSSDILRSYSEYEKNTSELKKKLEINNLKTGPVTSADLEVNQEIIQGIKEKYPNQQWLFLSEESTKDFQNNNKLLSEDWIWIIDPLDGTKDFINNTGEYAVHISLTYKKKNILAAVLIPFKEELWIYLQGEGSWSENRFLEKKIYKCSQKKELSSIRVVISKSHRYPELNNLINKIKPAEIIGMGSIGYKIASIIRNNADLYISFSDENKSCPKDWDMAAPEAIIKGCGGEFTDLYGNNLSFLKDNQYKQGGILIASMTKNHKDICNRIRKLIA
ncbi:MAG: 3'(2'),5'-bisphosphate nucleotidase CysQ [Prochlorococcus sp. SP3034]|nr:3'(2'),5'-bisphosphate nucleotidase CysQ [Prochlorococcus sp. SP3034]|tara:strand:- start:10654 stop:11544 length:891 start_codon:yes stop_codon:yes gene_type:complete